MILSTYLPTEEEDAAINAGIAADPDTWEATEEDFARMRPAEEVAPEVVEVYRRSRGRLHKEHPKVSTTIRLSPEVVEHFKAGGREWQTRINEVLKEYVASHQSLENPKGPNHAIQPTW